MPYVYSSKTNTFVVSVYGLDGAYRYDIIARHRQDGQMVCLYDTAVLQ